MDLIKIVKPSRFVFFLACLAAMAMLFISEGAYWQSVAALDKLAYVGQARASIQAVDRGILAAEAGQRGYLLTRNEEYLQSYNSAVKEVESSFTFLEAYYRANEKKNVDLTDLRALWNAKLAETAAAIRLHEDQKTDVSTAIAMSDLNKDQMEAMHALSKKLLDEIAQTVLTGRGDIYRTLMLSRVGLAMLSAACLFAMYLYLRNSSVLKQHELELKTLLKAKGERLEAEVVERTAQLTDLTRYLQHAREDERNRLARNLHDDLGALLTSAKLDAARIKSRLAATAPEALEVLSHLVGTLNSSIALGRRIIEDLRPSALSNLGLVPTLEILASEFSEQSGIQVHSALEPVHLEPNAALMVYRLVQEAFTNITKYAAAKQVWVTLAMVDGQVTASVRDDGVGFDTTLQRNSAYGLMGMRYRVEAEGGVLIMTSSPGAGTLIQATLPAGAAPPVTQPADL